MKNMTAAFGTTRIRWALRPPYNDLIPSSAMINLNVCHRPVYLITPFTHGSRRRVRRTCTDDVRPYEMWKESQTNLMRI